MIYVALDATGLARGALDVEVGRSRRLLEQRRAGLPHVMEVVSRHAITDADRFAMEPGFRNLDRARGGQLLARDARGEILAPRDGLVILPLYQPSGSDGFFWGREIERPASARLRAAEAHRRGPRARAAARRAPRRRAPHAPLDRPPLREPLPPRRLPAAGLPPRAPV